VLKYKPAVGRSDKQVFEKNVFCRQKEVPSKFQDFRFCNQKEPIRSRATDKIKKKELNDNPYLARAKALRLSCHTDFTDKLALKRFCSLQSKGIAVAMP